ncbi:hypothetical protein DICVIV_14352 [Dictyocaulus viviparus]|uniref:Uncharacterized protein n=1 Tax=Dictyocaulus viviparus TaxID=29172 RepID=A0A0D8X5F7_DICVI|nr:hypothetical protein DICVIV_14352 [Dictyocaulus viviparus]
MLKATILPLIVSFLNLMDKLPEKSVNELCFIIFSLPLMQFWYGLGVAVAMLLHPGNPLIKFRRLTTDDKVAMNVTTIEKFLDLIRSIWYFIKGFV